MTCERANTGSGGRRAARPRVLVADDDKSVRGLVAHFFAGASWSASFAEGGEAALALARAEAFDLVLMDLEMPGMDGEAAATTLRREELAQGRPPTPVVALSAHVGEPGYMVREPFCGAIAKPFTRDGLLGAVEQQLGLAREERVHPPVHTPGTTDPALQPLLPKLYDSVAELAASAAAGLESGDMPRVGRAGHKMRGAASCFGVREVAEAARLLERAARDGDAAAAGAALDAVISALGGGLPPVDHSSNNA